MLWGVSALTCYFFQNFTFPDFQSIKHVARPIEIAIKILVWIYLARLVFNQCSTDWNWKRKKKLVSNFLTKFFFMHHLCLGFTCIALFLYPSCSFAIISLIVFTHNMHTLRYIGYSTWSKNCLINFWAMYFLVYVFFLCVNCRKYFS